MRKIILFSIWTFLLTGTLAAQDWLRRYGQEAVVEQGRFITRTNNGSYLIRVSEGDDPAFSSLLHIDADGDSIWNFRAGPFPTGGGADTLATDRVFVNAADEIFSVFYDSLFKFNAGGQRLWAIPTDFFHMLGLHGDGVVLWKGAPSSDSLFLRKYNFDGGLLWEKNYAISGELHDVKMAPDGLILALSVDGLAFINRYNQSGNVLPRLSYTSTIYRKITFDAVGNYILYETLLSGQQGANNAVVILKSTPSGTVLWKKTYLISSQDAVTQIIPVINGDLILVGRNWYDPLITPRLYSLDLDGNERWKQSFQTTHSTAFYDARSNPDGTFVLTGSMTQAPGAAGNTDAVIWKFNDEGLLLSSNLLTGRLVRDTSGDCEAQTQEPGMGGWLVQAGASSCVTSPDGRYLLQVDSGAWALQLTPPGTWWQVCPGFDSVTFAGQFQIRNLDIPVFPQVECAQMEVSIGFSNIRRCFVNTATIQWCNKGTVAEPVARILVVLPPELDFTNAGWPPSQINGDSLWFDIGYVDVDACGSFQLQAVANCDSTVLGQSLCTEVHIYPDTFCLLSPNWSGAHVEINAHCLGDTAVEFRLKNTGKVPTAPGLDYIIIEDQVVLMTAPYSLPAGGELVVLQPVKSGSLYRMEAEQEPFHPGYSQPAAWAEGCGAAENQGLGLQYFADDRDLFSDIDCRQVIGSYDPNDKSAHPSGYDSDHFIEPNTDLTYRINFQNTGTDTAFTVILRDTLSDLLDPRSIRPEAASHPFRWNLVEGNILKFIFDNILLPDSTTDETGSQGYVQFRISQKPNVPLGNLIHNTAAIYFDFNLPVITNETFHTIGRNFMLVFVDEAKPVMLDLQVFPNPFRETAVFQFDTEVQGILSIYNIQGQVLHREAIDGQSVRFERNGLPNGVYIFDVRSAEGRLLVSGRLVAH